MLGRHTWTACGTALLLGALAAPTESHACGGCFAPPENVSVVTDHRMAMSIQATQSILWDQIRYAGQPQNFSWVLPVQGEVTIDVASGDFFDQLDAATAPQVIAPPSTCPTTRSNTASSTTSLAGGASDDGSGVTVLHTAVVGPYQTVTLRSTSTDALTEWLQMNGYVIPSAVVPVIAYYNAMHMDFVALRLAPGEGVTAMQPIRVTFASATTVLPLRMVSAGVASKVGLTLWVFSEGRYEAQNFANGTINPDDLVWDFSTRTSNYESVFASTGQSLGGAAWITQAAGPAEQYQYYQSATGPTDDWGLATANLPVAWVTRMRADLPLESLNQDLQLAASTDDSAVQNTLQATHAVNRPPCPTDDGLYSGADSAQSGLSCVASPPGGHRDAPWVLAAALTGVAVALRRRGR